MESKVRLAKRAHCFHSNERISEMVIINTKVLQPDGITLITPALVPLGVKPEDYICGFDRCVFDSKLSVRYPRA